MINNKFLLDDVPEPEVMGHALDLSRPELAPIMGRCVSNSRRPLPVTFRPPSVLVVTRRDNQELELGQTFESHGWLSKVCRGPAQANCPVVRGEDCPLRKSVDAAVVFVNPAESQRNLGALPRLRCAADSSSPGVVVIEGRFDAPTCANRVATVGSQRGPKAVLAALTELGTRSQGRT